MYFGRVKSEATILLGHVKGREEEGAGNHIRCHLVDSTKGLLIWLNKFIFNQKLFNRGILNCTPHFIYFK